MVSYARVVKIYDDASSLMRFENEKYFGSKNALASAAVVNS
jgi:hypothetical protein